MHSDNVLNIISIAKAARATEVYLNFSELSEIPEELWALTDLTHLFLTGNLLNTLPAEIQLLSQLQHLDISGNLLCELPKEILSLKKLNTLDISSNQLTVLPEELCQLRNLTTLDCFGNALKKLPESLGQCLNLEHLRVGKNELVDLPKNIGRLSHLQTLDLSYNEINELPSSILTLTKLDNLDLAGNKIDLPFSYFEKYQYEPTSLLNKIRELQYQNSHRQLDQYRKKKASESFDNFLGRLDNLLEPFIIVNNQLHITAVQTETSRTLSDAAIFFEAINNDLLIIWAIIHSIQGGSDTHSYANTLMDRCYNNATLPLEEVDAECESLIELIQKAHHHIHSQPAQDLPRSMITQCHFGKGISISCQLSASRRTLHYLSYLWALDAFAATATMKTTIKPKGFLLEILKCSLDAHGLSLTKDPRIPPTLLTLSQRQRPYHVQFTNS